MKMLHVVQINIVRSAWKPLRLASHDEFFCGHPFLTLHGLRFTTTFDEMFETAAHDFIVE